MVVRQGPDGKYEDGRSPEDVYIDALRALRASPEVIDAARRAIAAREFARRLREGKPKSFYPISGVSSADEVGG